MSWGNKLLIVFICFAGMMITLVYKSYHTKFELVSKDYYGDELKYQDKIDGKNNAAKLTPVTIDQDSVCLTIQLPARAQGNGSSITGEAWFYSNNDAARDRKIRLTPGSDGKQRIDKKLLTQGNYEVKISWKEKDILYYHEAAYKVL